MFLEHFVESSNKHCRNSCYFQLAAVCFSNFSSCDQRKITSLVDLTQQQWSNGRKGLGYSLHSAHQAVCPAAEELWAMREEGHLFLILTKVHWSAMGGGPGSGSPAWPDIALITEVGRGACKIYCIP